MYISPLSINNLSSGNPLFGSSIRTVKNKAGDVIYRNTTTFFRGDLEWDKLCQYIRDKYRDADKVNILCYACSDGSEPMSIAMLLKENFGDDAKKFFPIIAKDIDDVMISRAKSFFVDMHYTDIKVINDFTNKHIKKYFSLPRSGIGLEMIPARIHSWFYKKIDYSVADISKDLDNIPSDNTILFCRNVWPYIGDDKKRLSVIEKLKSKMDKNCAIITGRFDNQNISTHNLLIAAGFKPVEYINNVYEIN